MPKKGAKKKVKRKSAHKKPHKEEKKEHEVTHRKRSSSLTMEERNSEKILVENFVSLQKVIVDLSVKFDNLSNQMSKLLGLFELSAKSLAEKDFNEEKDKKDKENILKKLDSLFEQNKIIAKGLTLLHEPAGNVNPNEQQQNSGTTMQVGGMPNPNEIPVPSPNDGMMSRNPTPNFEKGRPIDQYQKSISSQPPKFKQLPQG